jgi:hypothetical protein
MFEVLVPGYRQGSFGLDDFCQRFLHVAAKAHPDDQSLVDEWVGEALRTALARRPKPRHRGRRPAAAAMTNVMADLARKIQVEENLPLTLDGAFRRVVEVFQEVGLNNVSAHSVEGAVFPRPSKRRTGK